MSRKGKEREYEYEEAEEGEEEQQDAGEEGDVDGVNGQDGSDGARERDGDDWEESSRQSTWTPKHVMERPQPPTQEERDAELALLEAQARAGQNTNDPRAKARIKPRRTVDYFGPIMRWKLMRSLASNIGSLPHMRPQPNYVIDLMPPAAYGSNASTSFCTKYAHTSTNKIRTAVNCVRWTPEGRRVLTGSSSGELTIWNGLTFNFETILQAHDSAIRAFEWSHTGAWLVSCDHGGIIKYFQPNYNNVTLFNGHTEPIRDVSWAPDDARFVTGSDDGSIKIWDFERRECERSLTGHGYDVRAVKWHPTKALLVSGSKNNLVKFWDPRTGTDLRTLHDHKNSVQSVEWSPNGNMIASASRDQSVKVFDIRMMKEIQDFRGHVKEACSVTWHPVHHNHLVSGGYDGSLYYWNLDTPTPLDQVDFAHESQIWSLSFHPLGHILASGANDHTTRWWSRGRPGVSIAQDRFHVGREKAKELGGREDDNDDEDGDDFGGNGLPGIRAGNSAYMPGIAASSANMPNFAIPGTNLSTANSAGNPSIPGLDSGPRPAHNMGIPGLAAVQQLAATMNQDQPNQFNQRGPQVHPSRRNFDNRQQGGNRYGNNSGGNQQGGQGSTRFRPY